MVNLSHFGLLGPKGFFGPSEHFLGNFRPFGTLLAEPQSLKLPQMAQKPNNDENVAEGSRNWQNKFDFPRYP